MSARRLQTFFKVLRRRYGPGGAIGIDQPLPGKPGDVKCPSLRVGSDKQAIKGFVARDDFHLQLRQQRHPRLLVEQAFGQIGAFFVSDGNPALWQRPRLEWMSHDTIVTSSGGFENG